MTNEKHFLAMTDVQFKSDEQRDIEIDILHKFVRFEDTRTDEQKREDARAFATRHDVYTFGQVLEAPALPDWLQAECNVFETAQRQV